MNTLGSSAPSTHRDRPAVALFAALVLANASGAQTSDWPSWRGPLDTGASPDGDPPIRWSETENVRWKVALPGRGSGTPIVSGGLVFLLTAEAVDPAEYPPPDPERNAGLKPFQRKVAPSGRQRFSIVALRRADGSTVWSHVAHEALPHEGIHQDGTWAASSAVTDGEHVFACFGSFGLFAYDLAGERIWSRQLGELSRKGFGEGSTPALHGDTLVVQRDHAGPSVLVALDKRTGEERWRRSRDEPTSWSSPLIVEVGGTPIVVTSGSNRIRAYDLATGDLRWECDGLTSNVISTPVHAAGVVYAMSGFGGNALLAIRLAGARGDLTGTDAISWRLDRHTSYVPSPLLVHDRLYFLKVNTGILSVVDARTGKTLLDRERLDTVQNVYASPVAAAGRIYLVGRDGETEVRSSDARCELRAVNRLDDRFDASPAIAGRELYLRGAEYVYCIARDETGAGGR